MSDMFMSKNFIKKISMVIASLALMIPLASVNGTSVSAHRVHKHARVVRIMKHRNKHAHKHMARHMRVGSTNLYNSKVNAALNKEPNNKAYNTGFNDALNAKINRKLVHDGNYKQGYVQIIALDNYTDPTGKRIPKHLSKNAIDNAKMYYNYCILK